MRLDALLDATKRVHPLVHCITNNITVNDCANIIHAVGGAPTMAQDVREVEEITGLSRALLLNMGALGVQDSILLAAKTANALGRPIVLDPVAAGASRYRGDCCREVISTAQVAVIRGNASEIRALAEGTHTTVGVEANIRDLVTDDAAEEALTHLAAFAKRVDAVVVQTGKIDLVAAPTGEGAILKGGSPLMSRITGAGCMHSAVTAAIVAASPENPFAAAVCAAAIMNKCAELAEKRVTEMMEGTASFRTRLIDAVSLLTPADLETEPQLCLFK